MAAAFQQSKSQRWNKNWFFLREAFPFSDCCYHLDNFISGILSRNFIEFLTFHEKANNFKVYLRKVEAED